ncbi:MAG: flavin reductase family protein [Phyllobacterium sp.]|uniref:flavin reductase family protein n=1 Tax=Phyllobacterium sp. TaxID=1871046 RepID=UPI0030F34B26
MGLESEISFDRQAFRQALGQFPTGVCVVTCSAEFGQLGMTISSFNCLSLEPPLILFSIDRKAVSLPLWDKAAGYAVNVLAENQKDISNRFALSRSNKWEGMRFSHGYCGAPLLPGVAAVFECVPWAKHDAGDHILFIAEVRSFTSSIDRMPLVFSKGRYAALQSTEFVAPLWPLDIHY